MVLLDVVVTFSLVVVGGGFVVVICGNFEVVLVVVVKLVLAKVVASGIGSVVSVLGRTDVEVWDEVSVGMVSKGTKENSVLAVDGACVAGCELVGEGFLSGIGFDGLSLLPMISEEIGILTTKGSSSFRPLLLLLLGPPVLLCLST